MNQLPFNARIEACPEERGISGVRGQNVYQLTPRRQRKIKRQKAKGKRQKLRQIPYFYSQSKG